MVTVSASFTGPRFRFAPSPNGYLHIGHAYSALVGFRMAARMNGEFLLRVEDIDVGRSREAFIEAGFEDLAWLGLSWPSGVLRQSQNMSAYGQAAGELDQLGVLYPCFATRTEIANALDGAEVFDPDGAPIYPGLYRGMSVSEVARLKGEGRAFAMRIDMAKAVDVLRSRNGRRALTYFEMAEDGETREVVARPERWGDAVIVRKDVPASYHLAVVVDDAAQGITHVTRGQDLEAATDIHRLLQELLGLPEPVYHHHRLIVDPGGRKLSKSDGATSLRALRAAGLSREDVIARIEEEVGPLVGV